MTIKYIDIEEFCKIGFLQEVNRQFFHPLGLALEVMVEEDGSEHLGGIWDYRDDPEGMLFGKLNQAEADVKAQNVEYLRAQMARTRIEKFGWAIQPIETLSLDTPPEIRNLL